MNGILLVTGGEAPGSPIPGSTRDSVQKFTVPRSSIILSILFGNRLPSSFPVRTLLDQPAVRDIR